MYNNKSYRRNEKYKKWKQFKVRFLKFQKNYNLIICDENIFLIISFTIQIIFSQEFQLIFFCKKNLAGFVSHIIDIRLITLFTFSLHTSCRLHLMRCTRGNPIYGSLCCVLISSILDFHYVRMKDRRKNINFVFNTRSWFSNDRKKWETFNGNDDQHISLNVQWNLINLHEIHINCMRDSAQKKAYSVKLMEVLHNRSEIMSKKWNENWLEEIFWALNFLWDCMGNFGRNLEGI